MTRASSLVAAVLLTSAPVWAGPDCQALQQQRDQLARAAMQAEIDLLQSVRQRLCPRQEALATAANAGAQQGPQEEPLDQPLDYDAYIRCREQAEAELRRSRPVLHRNRRGFTYYTADGARLAGEADAVQEQLRVQCGR
ncbi:hypothetical protein [Cyanobium sp. PCC 7001]|uniref:hypothetical protein n=1 Tax=Cyanobium sp. PCC 7001 TaxID=180281 RepID=UPI0012EAEBDD|nr:hypothetical protein [Cyanobium sp. PCC 7001]